MYEKAGMHDENGAWQMIFGLDTDPDYQCQGLAAKVLMAFIEQARKEGRKGLVLTCKKRLIHYYARFGFVDEGGFGLNTRKCRVAPDEASPLRLESRLKEHKAFWVHPW